MMRGTAFTHVAMAMVLLLTLVTSVTAETPLYNVEVVEEGPSLGPGEDSVDTFLETQPNGDHYLLRGYGHEGEYRILDSNLSTVTVLEPPEEGFLIKGCTFSDWGLRFLVWGRAAGSANDTVHLFDADQGGYDTVLLTNVTVPLVTIDHAKLFATELILMVAGRDANGTSTVLFIETQTNGIRNRVEVPGDRTVIHSDVNKREVPVIDDEGGILVFGSTNWTLQETVPPSTSIPTVYEIHERRFWTLAMEDGKAIIGRTFGESPLYEDQVTDGPLDGVLYNKRPNGAMFVVTAIPGEDGGSTLEVWWTREGSWPRIHQMSLDKRVSFIHHVPDEESLFLVGYADGSVVQFSIDIHDIPPEPKQPFYKEGKYMVPLVVVVVALLLAWRWMVGQGSEDK